MPDERDSDGFYHSDDIPDEELRFAPVDNSDADSGVIHMAFDSVDEDTNVNVDNEPARTFEDLSLAELIGQFLRSPKQTRQTLSRVTRAQSISSGEPQLTVPIPVPTHSGQLTSDENITAIDIADSASAGNRILSFFSTQLEPKHIQLLLYLLAVVFGLIGSALFMGPGDVKRTEDNALIIGSPFIWLGFFVWLGAELIGNWQALHQWWGQIDRLNRVRWILRLVPVVVWLTALFSFTDSMTAPAELTLILVQTGINRVVIGIVIWLLIEVAVLLLRYSARQYPGMLSGWIGDIQNERKTHEVYRESALPAWRLITLNRLILLLSATVCSVLVWLGTPNNRISPPVIILWFLSAILWAFVFAPFRWSFFDWATNKVDTLHRIHWRGNIWAIVAFILIMVLGMGFRLVQLDTLPAEMTSDHVEKILDSLRVYNGDYNIFFANNGGREPIQMYLMSAFTTLPGLDFDHYTLKLLAALESLITLPILVWMGIELMGERNRRFGLVVGLLLAGLLAVSYWHVAISRQALRIVMTPIFTALLMIYLSRAMRHNRRSDYIKTALILGFGLYAYQAIRMLPVVVVVGITLAVLVRNISWRERFMYGVNLAVLVFISFMVFLPMFNYSLDDPDHFWRRTAGRILGDDVIMEELEDGTIVERQSTPEERAEAFNANVPILMTNVRNAMLMFNWKGDVGWISGIPNEPAMDIYTGTFLVLGLAAWGVLMLKSRDPVIWLIPIMIFIMLLPSALSIAYPLENPSHTRTSGAIPPAYLMAAFPIALIGFSFMQVFSRRFGLILAVLFFGGVILLANNRNTSLYFDQYPAIYEESSYPYDEAGGVLRGFAVSGGSYGNAFMIAYPHWWGHRAIGIAAGKPTWPNGIVSLSDLPDFMNTAQFRSDEFRLDPEKDLLFFLSPNDESSLAHLQHWFPDGREQIVQSNQIDDMYVLYRVPFLGQAGFDGFLLSVADTGEE